MVNEEGDDNEETSQDDPVTLVTGDPLTAKIAKITQAGVIIVEFSEDIRLAEGFDFIDNPERFQEVINLVILENNEPLSFTFELVEITEGGMEILLLFEDPMTVSTGIVLYLS